MRVGVSVHYTSNWKDLASVTIPILTDYCNKCGYSLSVVVTDIYPRYTGAEKIMSALDELEKNDTVMVLDLDVLITNFKIRVEDFLKDGFDFFITSDVNGINAGVFIIRKTEWALNFLYILLGSIGDINHCEQDAINDYVIRNGLQKIKVVKQPSFNSLLYEQYPDIKKESHDKGQWSKGHFLLHLPAIPNAKRIEIFNEIKKEIIYE